MAKLAIFSQEYKKLNPAQKEAVDTIEGSVMVVAGPGTGKTQILALRIGNILLKTDIKADGILCLTFTNSAVEAMKERLLHYIGKEGGAVNVFTFHSFGMKVIEEYFKVLGLSAPPKLLEDTDTAIFFDWILNENDWEYLRPRTDSMRYFQDLKSLISLLKRERITLKEFSKSIDKEIKDLSESKLKKDAKKTESLERTREVVRFIDLYEKEKQEKNLLDYDDVLEYLVKIVEKSEEVASSVRERYLYILIDEHQDSSRVQNEFLKAVWGPVERPDIFVVGDDRQLIYGFSGASIDHFQGFKKTFPEAKLIALVDNYRSTQIILDASHALLKSVMSDKKLLSQSREAHPIRLIEANTPEEEIIAAGLDIKAIGIDPSGCAIIMPKNAQVRSALELLHGLGLPVASLEALNIFDQEETRSFLRVLKVISSGDVPSLVLSFFDTPSGISPLEAHAFIAGENMREFSSDLLLRKRPATIFAASPVEKWINKLSKWKNDAQEKDLKLLLQTIGQELFENETESKLIKGKEILNTILGLLTKELERAPSLNLSEFVSYLQKLELYGEPVPLAVTPKEGIKVLTMHSSKGLEFDYVWIAHMDERSLTGGKKMGFTLPESIKEKVEERDIDAIKRKLYVAVTRAKKFCVLSYSVQSSKGGNQELAKIIADLPKEVFKKEQAKVLAEKAIRNKNFSELQKLVAEKYADRYVSVSLLNNFFECPWKWYFRNLLGLPEPTNENLEFGSAVHGAIDKILKLGRSPSQKDLDDLILPQEAFQVISKWVKNRLPEIKLNRQNEKNVSVRDDKFPHLNIYGKVDLLEYLSKNELRVTDFKTGSVRKKSEIEKLDDEERMSGNLRQLAMYSYLIKQSPKWKVNVSQSRLEFLEAKKASQSFYNTVIGPEQIEMIRKDITDYDRLVKSGKWLERPCHYNSYGKNTECQYCKMAEIYK